MNNRPVPLDLSKLAPANPTPSAPETPAAPFWPEELRAQVVTALRSVFDPEIPVNIYELGLIYDLQVTPANEVTIRMTLTSPACPVAGSLVGEVQAKIKAIPGVTEAKVDLVWDPPWDKERMSEAAKLQLGFY
jgi:FeS assembly SUF system protein